MTTEIVTYKDTLSNAEVSLSLTDVKRLFCPKATDQEAALFLELCRYQGLNPFVRDAYLLKFGDGVATMVVGKDSFTKRAEAHPQFAGMVAGVIVQDSSGAVEYRKGSLILDEEKLVGGWAEIHRMDRKIPTEIPVSFREYDTGRSGWKSMPGTMIRKVALVQALREAFPNTFAGLYDAAEMKVELPEEDAAEGMKQIAPPVVHTPKDRPAGEPSNPSGPFCDEHKVYFESKRSSKTRVTGWVHLKEDGGYCVWDGSAAPTEDAEPPMESVPEAIEETFEEVAAESTD